MNVEDARARILQIATDQRDTFIREHVYRLRAIHAMSPIQFFYNEGIKIIIANDKELAEHFGGYVGEFLKVKPEADPSARVTVYSSEGWETDRYENPFLYESCQKSHPTIHVQCSKRAGHVGDCTQYIRW